MAVAPAAPAPLLSLFSPSQPLTSLLRPPYPPILALDSELSARRWTEARPPVHPLLLPILLSLDPPDSLLLMGAECCLVHIKNWPASSQTQERKNKIAVKAILKWEMEIMNEMMEVELRLRWLRCE